MGAFHEGHISLMRSARSECDKVVVSLFVNPLQFGPKEDLTRYPRNEEADAAMAEKAGADVLFVPTAQDIYPRPSTLVHVPDLSERWEGAARPGHFDGVATVVSKLFHIVSPHVAFFGLKDLQQCQIIRRMAEDLNMRITLRLMPTIREVDGLALSSRNRYLDESSRATAPALYRELELTREALIAHPMQTDAALIEGRSRLKSLGFAVDYFTLVDLPDMVELQAPTQDSAIIAAAKLGGTRLIDNILLRR
jgi:pantoate--beta-alanine ligase